MDWVRGPIQRYVWIGRCMQIRRDMSKLSTVWDSSLGRCTRVQIFVVSVAVLVIVTTTEAMTMMIAMLMMTIVACSESHQKQGAGTPGLAV